MAGTRRRKVVTSRTIGDSDVSKAATAAVIGGGVAAAGLLRRRRSRRRDADARPRPFRLRRREPIPEGLRRVARDRIDHALEEVQGRANGDLPSAVHEARKDLKRLRATVRIARDELGQTKYRRENLRFRDMGRRLSGARDAQVLLESLGEICRRYPDEIDPKTLAPFRADLEQERDREAERLTADSEAIRQSVEELTAARRRVATWRLQSNRFETLEPGLRRIYRRGRRLYRQAKREPTDENLHEWRKRVKDLWYALQLLRPASPSRMRAWAAEAHHLSDLLGDDHDLAILHERALAARASGFTDPMGLAALLALISRRREQLRDEALKLGSRVYRRKPRSFTRNIGRRWRNRVGTATAA
jgi:CHAD domain-containing protein